MDILRVEGLSKRQNGIEVVKDISFTQRRFQKIALAGETGSGKSTLLRMIAGLIQPDAGEVVFEDERVLGPAEKLIPGHPRIAYLSQQFELRNNYRVEEVLEYANRLSSKEAASIFEICRITHLAKRRTDQVSGGEKQRIALARLLITSPGLLLLDEPYSNLDMIHKNILKSVIKDIGDKLQLTCMLISHDPSDTLSWADDIFVMKEGEIIQQGPPRQIYRQPVNEYVAALFGKYNHVPALFAGRIHSEKKFLRPEDFQLVHQQSGAIAGTVHAVIFMGSYWDIAVMVAGEEIVTVRTGTGDFSKGEEVYVVVR